MIKFQEWFEKKLVVGSYPYMVNVTFKPKLYDVIINVSDEWYPSIDSKHNEWIRCESHWFPMSEFKKDMGTNSIYGAMVVLWYAEQSDYMVYLHCHSGSNRSWTVAAAYYFLRTGQHLDKPTRKGYVNKLHQNCSEGLLPPLNETENWLNAIKNDLSEADMKMKIGILTLSKVNHIINF